MRTPHHSKDPSPHTQRSHPQSLSPSDHSSRLALATLTWSGTNNLTWDYIDHLPGRTFVQIPKRHQAKVAAVQNQLITHILQAGTDSDRSLPYWKAFIMPSWTLLAKPHSASDNSHTASQIIEDRLTLWELGLHEALHQQTHADTATQPLRNTSRKAQKQQMEARAARTATLVANREMSRALGTLVEQKQVIVDNRVADAVQSLFPIAAENRLLQRHHFRRWCY